MNFKLLTATLVGVALATVGCNSGSRSGGPKTVYGPGSTTAISQNTTAGATPGGGTTGGGTTGGGTTGGGGGGTAGTFNAGPTLNVARAQHTATVMNDGRVLVTGGSDGQGIIAESEVFDPTTNTWEAVSAIAPTQNDAFMIDPTGQFATARQLHTATAMANGLVLVCGGFGVERLDASGNPVFESMVTSYTFNPQTNSFVRAGDMSEGRGWHSAALLSTGSVLLSSGLDVNMASLRTGDVYDPNQDIWTSSTAASAEHTWGSLFTAVNQTVMAAGANVAQGQQGLSIVGFPSTRVELFNAQGNNFTAGTNNVGDRLFMGHEVMTTGDVFLAGGQGLDPQTQQLFVADTTEVYNAAASTFTSGPTLATARFGCEVAEIGTTSDQLIVGGIDAAGMPLISCEVWSVLNNAMVGTVNMSIERIDHRAVTLQDGRILVMGGFDVNNDPIDSSDLHTR
jgi:large repetitive protein